MADAGGSLSPADRLALRSIKWRTWAGWVVVAIMIFRYLVRPALDTWRAWHGMEPLPELPSLDFTDLLAIVGIPVGGALADRFNARVDY